MLVKAKEIFSWAEKNKCAVGAFNTVNLETTLAIIRASAKTKKPAIIQISEKTAVYAGIEPIFALIKAVAQTERGAKIAVHLDHGHDLKIIEACLKAGFSSVQIDASDLPLEKNIAKTKKAVVLARKYGATIQGEIGALPGREGLLKLDKEIRNYFTDPAEAEEFVRATKVDTLAASFGAFHGRFPGREKIDFPRLKAIAGKTKKPLILHGGSGLKSAEIKKAIRLGVRAVNIDTDLRLAFIGALEAAWKKKSGHYHDIRDLLSPAMAAVQKAVEEKIRFFSS